MLGQGPRVDTQETWDAFLNRSRRPPAELGKARSSRSCLYYTAVLRAEVFVLTRPAATAKVPPTDCDSGPQARLSETSCFHLSRPRRLRRYLLAGTGGDQHGDPGVHRRRRFFRNVHQTTNELRSLEGASSRPLPKNARLLDLSTTPTRGPTHAGAPSGLLEDRHAAWLLPPYRRPRMERAHHRLCQRTTRFARKSPLGTARGRTLDFDRRNPTRARQVCPASRADNLELQADPAREPGIGTPSPSRALPRLVLRGTCGQAQHPSAETRRASRYLPGG
jgi:hypothetical protein